MNIKKRFRIIILTIPALLIISAVVFFIISYSYPYHYLRDCFYLNKEEFNQIVLYLKDTYREDQTHIVINTNSDYNEINEVLTRLKEQYQNDSEYPVFSSVDAYYDEEGNMMLTIQARKEKIMSGDGMENPDIRCYELVYIDENYNCDSIIKSQKPFCGNWYTWSYNTFSG